MTPPTTDIEFLTELVEQKPTGRGPRTVSEYVHGHRIMPAGTPLPGIVDVYHTPYLIEIMDNMSPSSPVQEQDIMKSVQSALTFGAENVIMPWCAEWHAEVLYITGTEALLKKWGKRLEPCIDSCGIRDKIISQITDKKTRTTGDKQLSKRFMGGGGLSMGSAQSASSLRSDSIQVLVIDEVDSAPELLKTGEGNYVDVAGGRTEAFGWKKKIMRFSTPTTYEASIIYKLFKLGDQREYYVPCKRCGKHFYMEFKQLVPEFKGGFLDLAWLKCPHCDEPHFNHDKTEMLKIGNAFWKPEAISSSKYRRSYHVSKYMVPIGLASWTDIYQEYLKAKKAGPDGMRSFVNLQSGLPYKQLGVSPPLEKVIELKGAYHSREIPDGVLFLTCAVDVQRGSQTDAKSPPRLEMEILGHGAEFRTSSIEYKVFTGRIWRIDKKTGESVPITGGAAEAEKIDRELYEIEYDLGIDNPYKGAWAELHGWAVDNFTYTRADGMKFTPRIVFIDSGDGDPVSMQAVYAFCRRPDWKNTYPIKGRGQIKRKLKGETGDPVDDNSMIKYRPHRAPDTREIEFYNISTWHYKAHLFNNLTVKRQPFDPQSPHFCDFPQDYPEEYFKQLIASDKMPDGSFKDKDRAHEALDVRVYGLCAADVWLASRMVWYRKQMLAGQAKRPVERRRSQHEIDEMIDFRYTLRMLEKETGKRELK